MNIKVYTPKEVAEVLKVSYRLVLDEIKAGKLKASKVGRGYRITEEQLKRYLEDTQEESQEESQEQ